MVRIKAMKEQQELDPIACFLTACEMERREHRASGREHKVVHGRRILAEQGRFLYCFETAHEFPLKEYASVQVVVNASWYFGTVVTRTHRTITIALGSDLGPLIASARIESEEVDLLQALIVRLKALRSDDLGREFNRQLATKILSLGEPATDCDISQAEKVPDDLTEDQAAAFSRSLSQPVTFLWGPPGTGKTVMLGALAWQLFSENKRVLVVSHTNHAVDGVVESLCKRIVEGGRSSIPEGSILRMGSMVRESLIAKFGEQVHLDLVIKRSHEKVATRLESLTKELSEVRNRLFETSKKLALLDSYAYLHTELRKLKSEARGEEVGIAQAVRRVFQSPSTAIEPPAPRSEELHESISLLEANLAEVTAQLQGCERAQLGELSVELSSRQLEITEAIAVLEKFTRDLRLNLLDRSRIVATTATQAMLSSRDLHHFDAVLIDEASMLPLPLCYMLSGLARERVVIAGDFRQLPSIASSDSHMVRQWYTRDIFECAGVVDAIDDGRVHPSIAALTTQFRSREVLCELINKRFYGGILRTVAREEQTREWPEGLRYLAEHPVVLVDTSGLSPRGHTVRKSKANLLHALLVRKVALSLVAAGEPPESIGVISPYRPQVTLMKELLEECDIGSVSVGSVHRFQGSERETIILDLTDSPPHQVGIFLGARSLRDTGARLLNVALSRARARLFVVANLDHLNQQLARDGVARGVLEDVRRVAYTVPPHTLIGEPIVPIPDSDDSSTPGFLAFQAFDHELFFPALITDLVEARHEVVLSAPSVSERGCSILHTLLKERIQRGLKVSVIIDGSRTANASETVALQSLRDAGALLIRSITPPVPFVVVDSEVVWLGSLSPADCLDRESGLMARSVSPRAAAVVLDLEGACGGVDATAKAVAV